MLTKLKQGPVLIVIPLIIGSLTLFFGLGTLYRNLISDERSLLLAADLLKGHPYYPYLIWPNVGTTHTFLIYLLQIPLNIMGYSVLALRLVPALFGLGGVIAFFILLRNIFGSFRIAVLGSTILSFTHWYLAMSRVTIELSEFLFFGIAQLIFLTLFCRANTSLFAVGIKPGKERPANWRGYPTVLLQDSSFVKTQGRRALVYIFLAGVSFGLMQHTYQSARFFVLFYLFFLPLYWLMNRVQPKEVIKQGGLFVFGVLLIIAPLIYVYLSHPESFDSRKVELVFSQNLKPQELFWSLKQSTLRTLGMFHFRGSDVRCYNIPRSPMLDPISGVLFVLGAVFSFKQLRKEFSLMLVLFFLVALLPSIFSYWPAAPHGLRAAGTIIPIVVWLSLGIERLATISKSSYSWIVVFAILAAVGFLNLKSYFVDLAALQDDCFQYNISTFDDYKREFLENTKGVKFVR